MTKSRQEALNDLKKKYDLEREKLEKKYSKIGLKRLDEISKITTQNKTIIDMTDDEFKKYLEGLSNLMSAYNNRKNFRKNEAHSAQNNQNRNQQNNFESHQN